MRAPAISWGSMIGAGRQMLRTGWYLTALPGVAILLTVLACFAFSPRARALKPPPDGGYSNNNTAEGDNALFSLTTGIGNTAIGFETLHSNTTGNYNVATGHHALVSNTTGSQNTANGYLTLYLNTIGSYNTATGAFAMTGVDEDADGYPADGVSRNGS